MSHLIQAALARSLPRRFLTAGSGMLLTLAAASGSAASKAETPTYVVQLNAKPNYEAGKPAALEIVILAKAGYKINEKYPTKFALDAAPAGITYPKAVLNKGDGTFEQKRALMKLVFVPSKAGTAKVGGKASFSVCSPSACVVGKQHVEVTVRVK